MKLKYIVLASLCILAACNTKIKKENEELKAEIESLRNENDSIRSEKVSMAATVTNYRNTLEDINNNLASIDKTKGMISKISSEMEEGDDKVETIKQHIENIRELLENSRLKILTLDKNLNLLRKESKDKSEEILALDNKVKSVGDQLLTKQEELFEIESDLRMQVNDLDKMLTEEMSKSAELKAMLNRAHYIQASSKELKDLGVVKREGGFIGLGRVKVLNATAADTTFIQIEKDRTNAIELSGKKASLITMHPEGSYTLNEDEKMLIINDNEAFWRNSNYLVIEVGGL